MYYKNTAFVVTAVAILLMAAFGISVVNPSGDRGMDHTGYIDLYGNEEIATTSDGFTTFVEKDDFTIYSLTSYQNFSFENGFETTAKAGNNTEKTRMQTELKVPKGVIGKSHLKSDFYDGDTFVKTLEMDVMSVLTPEKEFDVIMFFENEKYSARQLIANDGMEECNAALAWLGYWAVELLIMGGIISFLICTAATYSYQDGWGVKYTIKPGDGSTLTVDIRVNENTRQLWLNGTWVDLILADSVFYNSSDNTAGKFRFAAILNYNVYVANLTIDKNFARCIVKADKDSLQGGIDIYTKNESDAKEVAKAKTGRSTPSYKLHWSPDAPPGSIAYCHHHGKDPAAVGRGIHEYNVHVFFGDPRLKT